MNKKVKLINDFCNDNINFTSDYSYEDLVVLMNLDMGDACKHTIIESSDEYKISLYTKIVNIHTIISNIKILAFHGIVCDCFGAPHYVFKVNDGNRTYIRCHHSIFKYCTIHEKYYTKKPYYLGDYFIFTEPHISISSLIRCSFHPTDKTIGINHVERFNMNKYVYWFRSFNAADKAIKVGMKSPKLFKQLYNFNKMYKI